MVAEYYMGEAYGFAVGIGSLLISMAVAYMLYCFARWVKEATWNMEKTEIVKGLILDKLSKRKGYNVEKELLRREAAKKHKHDFIGKMEQKVFEDMFGKE